MGLFTVPMTLNDGVANRVFTFLRQEPDNNVIVAKYCEDAAALAANSRLIVKHDDRKTVKRHLLQRQIYLTPAADPDSGLSLLTFNFTVNCANLFTVAEIKPEFVLFLDALGETNFIDNLMAGKI